MPPCPSTSNTAAVVVLTVPLSYVLAALWAARRCSRSSLWRVAGIGASLALCGAVAATVTWLRCGNGSAAPLLAWHSTGAFTPSVRLDVLTVAMLLLVTFIGGAIVRFSRNYLDGDPAQIRYVRWLMATLAAVTLLVCSDNLLWLSLAWIASSLALHRLLLLYPERPAACMAARKKFVASRVADLALLCAIALIGLRTGTLDIGVLQSAEIANTAPSLAVAGLLVVVAVGLKSAQLPFHGWLIQVMEAPTPVSALLHAGVVNIGGFLLIRLAPLFASAGAAQTALVVWGTATVAIASLVMTTRVSIKVALAWSTCAQMGFMLIECGLGAYSIALLHLIGHSLYKAHAFLESGNALERWSLGRQTPAPRSASAAQWIVAHLASGAVVTAIAFALGSHVRDDPAFLVMTAVLCIAVATLFGAALQARELRYAIVPAAAGVTLATSGLLLHELIATYVPKGSPSTVQLLIAAIGLCATCAVYAVLRVRPHSQFAARLQPLLFAGLYLDDLVTRMTLRLGRAPVAPRPRFEQRAPTLTTPAEATR